jgi:sugar phosphate permease
VSILTGGVLPVFSILCIAGANLLYRKVIKNEMLCSAVIFAVGCVSAVLLSVFRSSNPLLSVLFLALLSGSMHGVNLMLTCMVPPHFAQFGRTALVSGGLNSCTHVGAALSTYGIALFTESFGWDGTILLWAGIALAGTLVCFLVSIPWRSFRTK